MTSVGGGVIVAEHTKLERALKPYEITDVESDFNIIVAEHTKLERALKRAQYNRTERGKPGA